jgi:hypothetical protein
MAPKSDGLALTLGMVVAIAVVTTWLAPLNPKNDLVAPIPPRETIYRPEHWSASDVASVEGFSPRLSFFDSHDALGARAHGAARCDKPRPASGVPPWRVGALTRSAPCLICALG